MQVCDALMRADVALCGACRVRGGGGAPCALRRPLGRPRVALVQVDLRPWTYTPGHYMVQMLCLLLRPDLGTFVLNGSASPNTLTR